MSSDKRTVTTDALETLGTIITDKEKRDAIHLAVEPAVAVEDLQPGQHVGFVKGGVGACKTPVGIVDPFVNETIKKGERFWLVVYPRQITSLRHVWTHPAFEVTEEPKQSSARELSEAWLRNFVDTSDCPDYETLVAGAIGQIAKMEEYDDLKHLHFNGSDAHGDIPSEFWHHVEIVTGMHIPLDKRAVYFSCSC